MTTSARLLIAKITTAHGVKGLVKLHYYGENPDDLAAYNPLFMSENGSETMVVNLKNRVKGGFVAEIEGLSDRNGAEALRGQKLYIESTARPDTAEGEFYHSDLIGCRALEQGQEIGSVIAVENFGAGDLLEIKPVDGGETFYLPFNDETVPQIDLAAGILDVIIPDGLR